MSRRARLATIALAVASFVLVSALLGRVLAVGNGERNAVVAVVRAEARGDERVALADFPRCRADSRCRQGLRRTIGHVRRSGRVDILRYDGPGGFPLGGRGGHARVVWRVGDSLPVVQCVGVASSGNPVSGYDVRITSVGEPIAREASCRRQAKR